MRSRTILRLAMFAVLGAAIAAAFFYRAELSPAALEERLQSFGLWTAVAFVSVYAIATVLFMPGSVFALAGGALFGPVLGTVFNLGAATVGATAAFLVARYLASDWVAQKSGPRLKQLLAGVDDEGWRFVAFTRLVPLFPFNLLNYALGLTRIGLLPYVLATAISMIPGAAAYTYLGYAGREAVAGREGAIEKGLLAPALLAVAVFLPRLVKRLRRPAVLSAGELRRRLDGKEDLLLLDVRDEADFNGEHGHVPGAVNIPLPNLPNRMAELRDSSDRPLAVMCFTDRKSKAAIKMLGKSGFDTALLVDGGMKEWNRLGYPATRHKGPMH